MELIFPNYEDIVRLANKNNDKLLSYSDYYKRIFSLDGTLVSVMAQ